MTAAVASHEPAPVESPGGMLRRVLRARGLDQVTLSWIIGRPAQAISAIVNDKKKITAATACDLEDATGIPAAEWLDCVIRYELAIAALRMKPGTLEAIGERARLVEARIARMKRFPLSEATRILVNLRKAAAR